LTVCRVTVLSILRPYVVSSDSLSPDHRIDCVSMHLSGAGTSR
jgi:hypothetical protein